MKICKEHFAEFSSDVQKFLTALRKVKSSNPTSIHDENNLSIAVALHVWKISVMDYN